MSAAQLTSVSEMLSLFQAPFWGGMGIALLSGPLGALLVWQRLAYLGDALAHASLLGVGLGLLLAWPIVPTTLVVTGFLALLLWSFLSTKAQPSEGFLLLFTQGFMGLGLLLMSCTRLSSVDLMAYLVGDFLILSSLDVALIWAVGGGFLLFLFRFWRPILALVVHPDLAAVEGVPVRRLQLTFLLFASLILVFALQTTGILLVTALLVFPILSLHPWVRTPKALCVSASLLGIVSVWGGLGCALIWDAPPGPLMTVFLFGFFLLSQCSLQIYKK